METSELIVALRRASDQVDNIALQMMLIMAANRLEALDHG